MRTCLYSYFQVKKSGCTPGVITTCARWKKNEKNRQTNGRARQAHIEKRSKKRRMRTTGASPKDDALSMGQNL
jgi:hypothetical protein